MKNQKYLKSWPNQMTEPLVYTRKKGRYMIKMQFLPHDPTHVTVFVCLPSFVMPGRKSPPTKDQVDALVRDVLERVKKVKK